MRDPHQNIFFYYRGPSKKQKDSLYDPQVEDNTTKSFINILEFCHQAGFDNLLSSILNQIDAPKKPVVSFLLQKGLNASRPDAVIEFSDRRIHVESKVKASLDIDQVKRHLDSINSQDLLVVITNRSEDKRELETIGDGRIKYLCWSTIHKICRNAINITQADRRFVAVTQLIKHLIDYLEVIVMTEFSGFNDADFDYWIDPNPYYRPILKKKLEALATIIRERLPKSIGSEYSFIKPGKISHKLSDDRRAWVAIKKPKNNKDIFNQCNFTIEVSKNSLEINAVIRNGRTCDKGKPLGVFYTKLTHDTGAFLDTIRNIKKDARIIISRRYRKARSEWWRQYFDMKLCEISNEKDVLYLCEILKKADTNSTFPGVRIRYSIDRGSKILSDPKKLEDEIISTIYEFKPILDYLERK
ncbi:MAG: hypothetical protein PHW54_02600 [Candidatus Omnitrophica bacterium]|nr:hypothetical protein [Candidatus Omnitrophota bacterium]